MKIDTKRNKGYYKSKEIELCDCKYCKIYYKKIKKSYPKIYKYLSNIGVDIEKPFELIYLEPENGKVEYIGCQYVIFGNCNSDYFYKINDVEFRKSKVHPSTNIEEEHFILEFGPILLTE